MVEAEERSRSTNIEVGTHEGIILADMYQSQEL